MEPNDDLQNFVEQKPVWSMEIIPHNINDVSLIPEFVNEIYITMIPGADCWETIKQQMEFKQQVNRQFHILQPVVFPILKC